MKLTIDGVDVRVYSRSCVHCGAPFRTTLISRTICSRACREERRREQNREHVRRHRARQRSGVGDQEAVRADDPAV